MTLSTVPAVVRRERVSRREVMGAAVLGILIVVVELVLVGSYLRGAEVSREFSSTSSLITTLANAQREVLRLHVEVDQLADDPASGTRAVEQQRSILRSTLRTLTAATSDRPDMRQAIGSVTRELDSIDVVIDTAAASGQLEPATIQALDTRLRELERHTKRLYDQEEMAYFAYTSDSLGASATSQLVMLVVAIAIAVLGVILGMLLRRRLKDEFARAYFRLEAEMTEREKAEQALRHQAYHDALTGAPNRALFIERLEAALRVHREGALAILFVDLDDFKTINDSLGHGAGDVVLKTVVDRIRACLRPTDTVARMGGDEFAVLVPQAGSIKTVEGVARRILEALQRPMTVAGTMLVMSATIGIAEASAGDPAATTEMLLRNADLAMYAAKSAGKDRFDVYQAHMHDAALRRLGERAELERALANHEMVLHYQPIVDLATGAVAGLEALIRWNHPTRGLIGPDEFIGTAEETGLIVPIGRWALDTACNQVARWVREGIVPVDLGLSVNLSPRQLQDEHLVADVAAAIRRSGLAPACLTLEMTETLLVDDMSAAVITLDALKALDVRLAIDDFGTGYSSINYLSRLPIDILKVDRSFVAAASDPGDPRARLARTMLGLGHSVGMPAVAEGIESAAQASLVRELGCQFGQGFHFGRPVDAAATRRLFRIAPEHSSRPVSAAAPRELLPGPHAVRIPA